MAASNLASRSGMSERSDTIAAIATARGKAALAVLRTSGTHAIDVADSCFKSSAPLATVAANTVHFGYVVGADGRSIDQVVATVFRAPRSATGEDVVEFSCHGGDVAARLILERLLEAGARLAEPGEFTQRAFLNGKIDLAQAEAVADLIHSSSTLSHRVSLNQLTGRYSDLLSSLRTELLDVAALVELELDFPEEDVEFADRNRLVEIVNRASELLSGLLASYRTGALVRDGVRVVIGGKPNAGKSTLLNALVGLDRAIVSPTPGTTRDEIEAHAEIGGVLFKFIDTAGLRDTTDAIEAEGVRRARAALSAADLVLYVVDSCEPLDREEVAYLEGLAAEMQGLPLLLVLNKSDLVDLETLTSLGDLHSTERLAQKTLALSADRGRSDAAEIEPLVNWLITSAAEDLSRADASPIVTNQRHRQHLQNALESVVSVSTAMDQRLSGDILSVDLRRALFELGSITGEITNEDVLGAIFSRFCIGK